jgi:hypothetical protein
VHTHSFAVSFGEDFGLLVNDEGTRSFLTINLEGGGAKVRRLIKSVDEVLPRYKQPVYYEVTPLAARVLCHLPFLACTSGHGALWGWARCGIDPRALCVDVWYAVRKGP